MAIYKRENSKFWWMSFQYDGRHIQKSTKCANKRDAEAVERAFRTQLAKGEVGFEERRRPPKFKAAMKEFLAWVEVEHAAKPNTVYSYKCASKALLAFFDDVVIDEINAGRVEKFKQWRVVQRVFNRPKKKKGAKRKPRKKLAPATVNRELALLKIFFNYFIKCGNVDRNPVSEVKMLKENPPTERVLTGDEERLYLMAATQPLQDMACLMVDTGMRPSEIFNARLKDVNFDEGYLYVPEGKTKHARRFIPLTERAKTILGSNMPTAKQSYFFINEKTGKPFKNLKTAHAGTLKRSGVKHFRIYDLRHTFATRFVESGGDLMTLKELLGHSKIQMVVRYAHPTQKHKVEAIRRMETNGLSATRKLCSIPARNTNTPLQN